MAVGIGAYNLQEASRYTGIPANSIARWLFSKDPLWTSQLINSGFRGIGFRDLMELRIVKKLREKGASLQTIRQLLKNAKQIFDDDYPLTNPRFLAEGKDIFSDAIKTAGNKKDPLFDPQKRQIILDEIIHPALTKGIIYCPENREAVLWYPDSKAFKNVVLDPTRSFGKPIIHTEGIRTSTLYNAFLTEQDKKLVAKIYEVPIQAVNSAVKYEESLNTRGIS